MFDSDSWIGWVLKGVFKACKRFFCWLLIWCLDICKDLANVVMSWVPADSTFFTSAVNTVAALDAWVPLGTVCSCAATYFGFIAAIAAFRFIKSFIPTLGG